MPAKKKSPATANRKKPKFRRVLLKISGEVLGGETGGICPESVHDVAAQVREVAKLGVQIGVVVGGGNIFRGLQGSEKGIERVTGDQMGMLATVINSMALQDALEKQGVPTRVQSAITMSQVAEAVGVHETTVSRAVSGKYIETPHGVLEMKYFFTAGLASKDGSSLANTSVKEIIGAIIEGEDPQKPLSDRKIVDLLAEKEISLARRTVAKYREELGIPATNLRRRY
mgnify:CR=1 FL=1